MESVRHYLAYEMASAILDAPESEDTKHEGLLDNCIFICDMAEAGMDEDGFEI